MSKQKNRNAAANPSLSPASAPAGKGLPPWAWMALLALSVAAFYLPVLRNGFVNFDDRQEIFQNPFLQNLGLPNLQWMFTNHQTYWMPLTWLSWALNYQMGGFDPKLFHLTNLALHIANTLLVFLAVSSLLRRARFGKSLDLGGEKREVMAAFLAALLFGLHPIHVESVAWAAERKDVLYGCFYLGALWVYLDERVLAGSTKAKGALCFSLFLLALMSKPMAVTLPLVLLILDDWPLGKLAGNLKGAVLEKIPYFLAVAFLWNLMTRLQNPMAPGELPFWILNGFRSIVFYILKMALPLGLTPFYPFPHQMAGDYQTQNILALLAVLGLSAALFYFRRRWPFLWAAWLFYLVSLAPVSGFVRTGSFAAADRYTYLPSLGLLVPAAVLLTLLFSRRNLYFALLVLGLGGALGLATSAQIGVWKNSQTFWECVVGNYPNDNPNALTNLGFIYLEEGRVEDAIGLFDRALSIPPPLAFTHEGMGMALFKKGNLPDAAQELQLSIQMDPRYPAVYRHLAEVEEQMGKHLEAQAALAAAQKLEESTGLTPATEGP